MRKMHTGDIIVVKHILGKTAEALLTKLEDGRYQFNCDAYVEGETCSGGFFHLRQARPVIPGKNLGNNVRFWPRLRKALRKADVERVHIPGGGTPIHYCDEIVIPDFMSVGTFYYVIKYADIKMYLDQLPLDDSGKRKAEKIKKEIEEEEERRNSPQYVASRIGEMLSDKASFYGGKFKRVKLVQEDNSEFSIMYIKMKVENLEERHKAIADEVRNSERWLDLFDTQDFDGVNPELITKAEFVVLEAFDFEGEQLPERYIYRKEQDEVIRQIYVWMDEDVYLDVVN